MDHLPQENIPESSLLKLSFQIASVLCAVLSFISWNYQGSPPRLPLNTTKYHYKSFCVRFEKVLENFQILRKAWSTDIDEKQFLAIH